MIRGLRWRRLAPAALLGALAGVVLAPAGPDALVPLGDLAAAAATEVYVAVVIDFGPGGPASIVQCVGVPAGDTDSDALAQVVNSQVSYASSGLLCAIDGYPANGVAECDRTSGQLYYFWSYWHGGSGTWQYANDGPSEVTVSPGDVEGWRFENPGPANPSAPSPGAAPDYAAICPTSLTTPTTTATSIAPTTPTTSPSIPGQAAPAAPPATTTPVPTTAAPGSAGPVVPSTAPRRAAVPAASPPPSAPPTTAISATTVAARPAGSKSEDTKASRQAQALAAGRDHGGSASSGWAPAVIGALIVVALGTGAFIARRRRPGAP